MKNNVLNLTELSKRKDAKRKTKMNILMEALQEEFEHFLIINTIDLPQPSDIPNEEQLHEFFMYGLHMKIVEFFEEEYGIFHKDDGGTLCFLESKTYTKLSIVEPALFTRVSFVNEDKQYPFHMNVIIRVHKSVLSSKNENELTVATFASLSEMTEGKEGTLEDEETENNESK